MVSTLSSKLIDCVGDEAIVQAVDDSIFAITTKGCGGETELKDFFGTFVEKLGTCKKTTLSRIGEMCTAQLFPKSLQSFNIFLNIVFDGLAPDEVIKLTCKVIKSPELHEALRSGSSNHLNQVAATAKKYFENDFNIHDKILSLCFSYLIRESYVDASLLGLLRNINFASSHEDLHLAPLYHSFMVEGTNIQRLDFMQKLLETRSLHFFDSLVVTKDTPLKNILSTIFQLSLNIGTTSAGAYNSVLKAPTPDKSFFGSVILPPCFKEKNFSGTGVRNEKNKFNNTIFLEHICHYLSRVRTSMRPIFVRLIYFSAYGANLSTQSNHTLDTSKQGNVHKICTLLAKCESLSIGGMNLYVLKRLHAALPSLCPVDFSDAIFRVCDALEHLSSINVRYVNELFRITHRVGRISSGKDAVEGLFKDIFGKSDMLLWDASSLNDRLFYVYCYVKYPLESKGSKDCFIKWASDLNEGKEFSLSIGPNFYTRFDEKKRHNHLIGLNELSKHGFNFLQNSQLYAVFCALDATDKGLHFFGKLGTGQGKSVVFALLAIQYVKKYGKKVVVFSCYDHLAKRDHKTFKKLFSENGINSQHLSSCSKEEFGADVLYADMDTFISMYDRNIEALAHGVKDYLFDVTSFTVCLLDEFDALMIDSSSIGNYAYDMFDFLNLSRANDGPSGRASFIMRMRDDPAHAVMRERLESHGNGSLLSNWVLSWSDRSGVSEADAFGIQRDYIGGILHQLKEGRFTISLSRWHVLSYLLNMPTIVGLSGSVSMESICRFRTVLKKPDDSDGFVYMEIPNFFGSSSRNVLQTFAENRSKEMWLRVVEEDLATMLKYNPPVPVLVFGDVNESAGWNELKLLIRRLAVRFDRRELFLETEDQVEPLTMSKASHPDYITLATHIVGRGADFRVKQNGGGMHVCVAGVPNDDARLMLQMIGRTARMDSEGTHSIILKSRKPEEDTYPFEIKAFDKDMSFVQHMVNMQLLSEPYSKANWEKWILILNAIKAAEVWPKGFDGTTREKKAELLLYYICDEDMGYFRDALTQPSAQIDPQPCCAIM